MELGTILYCLRFETSLFVASYDSQAYGGSTQPRLHTGMSSESESELLYDWRFTTNQFVWAPSPLKVTARIFSNENPRSYSSYNILSDERIGLSFTIAAGPRQRIHSRIRVPWDSRPYFTVSDSRFPFLSPPTTRWAMVEVFDPAPHGNPVRSVCLSKSKSKLYVLRPEPSFTFHSLRSSEPPSPTQLSRNSHVLYFLLSSLRCPQSRDHPSPPTLPVIHSQTIVLRLVLFPGWPLWGADVFPAI
jgi:hypothetical protein